MCRLDCSSVTSEKSFDLTFYVKKASNDIICLRYSATQTHRFDLVSVIHLNAGWRAAEEDIIQCPIILLGHGRLVFVGCWGSGGKTRAKHQVSHSVPMNGQWLSINLACQLVSRPETNYNVHLEAI